MSRALVCAAVIAALAAPAVAESPPVRRHNVAAAVHGLIGAGLVLEGELQLRPRWSVAGFGGGRASVSGDFSGGTAGLGAEVRWWLLGWTVKSPLADSIVGGYFGTGLELSRSWLRDDVTGSSLGSTTSAAVTGSFGYRFAPWSRVSITPSVGLAIGRDLAGGVPDRFSIRPRWGVTLGVLF